MNFSDLARQNVPQITTTALLVAYALARKKLTPGGVLTAVLIAIVHMAHPWQAFFWLPIAFFFLGTFVTKIGHEAKSHLTQSATGGSGGEGARTAAQVWSNSGFACILITLHIYLLSSSPFISSTLPISAGIYASTLSKLLPIGIIAQYTAVTADTFSSELGILAKTTPFPITAPWKRVPRGTNGGVTVDGLMYGALGSLLLTLVAIVALFFSSPSRAVDPTIIVLFTLSGVAGTIIDSVLGAVVQATVSDKRSGRVIEGHGGERVRVAVGGSRVQTGWDLLTNNEVNFWMAAITSVLTMGVAWMLGLSLG